jgi:SAM-dependent methyltransferase
VAAGFDGIGWRFHALYKSPFHCGHGQPSVVLLSMMSLVPHLDLAPPSDWVQRWSHLVKPSASLLDVACGSGRHVKLFADHGCKVTAVDVSSEALNIVKAHSPSARTLAADIENAAWPLQTNGQLETFDAVVVTNYLHRPLMPTLLASLAAGGVLIYETFAIGNETVGKPSRSDFLLKRGELLRVCQDVHIVAFEDGFLSQPGRFVQRIVATKMHGSPDIQSPPRFHL